MKRRIIPIEYSLTMLLYIHARKETKSMKSLRRVGMDSTRTDFSAATLDHVTPRMTPFTGRHVNPRLLACVRSTVYLTG